MAARISPASRLLAALEDLVAQELASLRAGDLVAVGSLQARLGAVVEKLCELAGGRLEPDFRPRLAAVLAQRRESQDLLARRIAANRDEWTGLAASRSRLGRLAPAYRRGGAASSRLNVAV